jgi:GT2 family glycosyltransferase
VVATHNRCAELVENLHRLTDLPERPPVIVVDNGSIDGTAQAAARVPGVEVIRLPDNRGAAGRNVGVARAATPYVAFADDDSWWEPGALRRAADLLDRHPRLALLAARILVGPGESLDPVSAAMAAAPLGRPPDLPGPAILGFLACGVVVRRAAFLAVGGFEPLLVVYGEEALLAMDLADAGWGLAYVEGVVARHHPSATRGSGDARRRRQARNDLLTLGLRRPPTRLAGGLLAALGTAGRDPVARGALVDAVRLTPAVLRRRRRLTRATERSVRRLERSRLRCPP